MRKLRNIISIICVVALLTSICTLPASANSAAPVWEGSNSSGVFVKEGDIPIVVESELLTFDIPTLPYAKYLDFETFLAYDSKVTAEYTFYNPTDMTIKATLFFPFNEHPEYGAASADEVMKKYGVYVNDEKIDSKIRHTYKINDGYHVGEIYYFDTNKHIALLHDEFIQDNFYTPDLTVTKYSYEVVGNATPSSYYQIIITEGGSERKTLVHNDYNTEVTADEGDKTHLLGSVREDYDRFVIKPMGGTKALKENERVTVSFYVLGKPLDMEPDAGWYATVDGKTTKIDGEINYLGSVETTTLKDFIFDRYNPEKGISEVDWYNACVTCMKMKEKTEGDICGIGSSIFTADVRWYEYEIVLEPGERLKNTVVSPVYPGIDATRTPYKYKYCYYLSPASGWADFGKLDIVINTPYEMSRSSVEGFEKTETGYKLSMDGLPKDGDNYMDLYFTLLNDGNTPLKQQAPKQGLFKRIAAFFRNIFQKVVQFVKSIFN